MNAPGARWNFLLILSMLTAPLLDMVAAERSTGASPLPPGAVVEKRGLNFTLLPKAFTPNPTMEMTVFSERTEFGRTLPEATPEQPVFYTAHQSGFHPMGAPIGGQHPPIPDELASLVTRALQERGYVAATNTDQPALLLNILWGSHTAMDLEEAQEFPLQHRREVLERARLVGGSGYARRIAFEWAYGSTIVDRSGKLDYLRYQTEHDLYYVVVSAYDYAGVAEGKKRLAWRTTMTVNAQGVNMRETLPPLVLTGAYYFGRDSGEPVALRRDVRRGSVNLGPLRVIESDVALSGAK